ncbi:MAG: OmpA family protein [Chloroflexota bacterium]
MAKKKHHEEGHVNHERWLVSYADMITLLMVLFVVLFAMGQTDKAKMDALRTSLQRAFSVEVLRGTEPSSLKGSSGSAMIQSIVPSAISQEVVAMTGGSGVDGQMAEALQEVREALIQVPIPSDTSGHVEVGASREGIVISLAGNLLFDSGKSDLKPRGMTLLDTLSERLRTMPNEIRVEGHTDNIPIATPLYPSNWELSSARATTVSRYFVEHNDIAPNRVSAAGFGEFRPVAPNDSREGRARNRRVDLVVLFPQSTGQMQAIAGARPPAPAPAAAPGARTSDAVAPGTGSSVANRGTQP